MTLEESEAEADRILSEAGWTTTLKPPWRGRHVAPGMVGGRAPDGNAYAKAYTAFPQCEAEARGLDPALYPDEPHEAAAVLVASVALVRAPEPEQIPRRYDEAPADYFAEHPEDKPQDETHRETGEEAADAAHHSDGSTLRSEEADAIRADDQDGASAGGPDGGAFAEQPGRDDHAEEWRDDTGGVLDADFVLPEIELIPPELDPTFGAELLEWEGELVAEPEPQPDPAGAFIFGDNLDQQRTALAGIVARIAEAHESAIDAEANEQPGEFAEVQGFVTTNLDKFTGAFSLQEPEALAKYHRWLELCRARDRKLAVNEHRRDMTKLALALSHAEIATFDPEAGWP